MPVEPIVIKNTQCDYSIFSDESHTDGNHSFMVIGGILCRSAEAHLIAKRISSIQQNSKFKESLQWKSISRRKIILYKQVIDEVLRLQAEHIIDFSCVVFEKGKINHARYNENDPETGFFKFLYQHHLKSQRQYGRHCKMRGFHGNMETRYDLNELKRCLNASVKGPHTPWKQVEFKNVCETHCLQIADVMIGAVGYCINGKYERNPNSPKSIVAKYLEANSPVDSLSLQSSWPDKGFSIWRFEL
ncbi:DUF3800 domain-containing protein [Sneathiella sp. CAU 1612]|uniref:DUF3800 domain-containing protein n=1 Tax=Sneathiella sedimenti TaxID=2816034 RepID=A0ABS3F940_9PROT|nr:DUF3800 domain-containing protein [Sneathiella sedimenti]MBO0334452.1 DUF3800 domain-containing protein [Sneathiella sedimenti]